MFWERGLETLAKILLRRTFHASMKSSGNRRRLPTKETGQGINLGSLI